MAALREVRSGDGTKLYKVQHPGLPTNSYIISMPAARKILYDPIVSGMELKKISLECSKEFLRTAWDILPSLKRLGTRKISEIVVLRGSLGYQFDVAFEQVFGRYLLRCFVGAKRFRISGGEFGADISYINFDALPNNGVLLVGDTVATGISLSKSLAVTRSELRERDYGIKKLLVFSIAASAKGCTRLVEWEDRFREWWPDFRIHLFVAEAFFGLADNGTDLLFRRGTEAILPDETKRRVSRIYGDYDTAYLPGIICSIFDWGDRNFKPERHLADVIKFARESAKSTNEKKAREILAHIMREARHKLNRF